MKKSSIRPVYPCPAAHSLRNTNRHRRLVNPHTISHSSPPPAPHYPVFSHVLVPILLIHAASRAYPPRVTHVSTPSYSYAPVSGAGRQFRASCPASMHAFRCNRIKTMSGLWWYIRMTCGVRCWCRETYRGAKRERGGGVECLDVWDMWYLRDKSPCVDWLLRFKHGEFRRGTKLMLLFS